MGLLDMTPEQSGMLLNLGQGLLSASGPSRTPVSFGQALAGGIGQMQRGRHEDLQMQLQAGHLRMQQWQMEQAAQAQELAKQRQAAIQEILPTLSPDLQRAYQMGVPADKIFDAQQQEKNAAELNQFLKGPAPDSAPRPYQAEVEAAQASPSAGRIVADTPEQRAGVERNLALMTAKYPQEAARLREQLIQQGLITPPAQQRQQPTADQIGEFGARWAAQGRKGGDEMLKLAALKQPNVKVIDTGNGNLMYDANSGSFIGAPIAKGMSPEAIAANQLGWANNDVARFNANKPTYHDGALVSPGGEVTKTPMYNPPKGSPEATAQSSAKVLPLLEMADKLLTSATGSYAGSARDSAAAIVGVSTEGAKAAAQLRALEGSLMMAQPRMEGPQGEKDVLLYKQMAAQIGDNTVPIETRRAALKVVKSLHEQYAGASPAKSDKTVVSRGTYNGKPVVKYSDGSVDYAN